MCCVNIVSHRVYTAAYFCILENSALCQHVKKHKFTSQWPTNFNTLDTTTKRSLAEPGLHFLETILTSKNGEVRPDSRDGLRLKLFEDV